MEEIPEKFVEICDVCDCEFDIREGAGLILSRGNLDFLCPRCHNIHGITKKLLKFNNMYLEQRVF